MKKSLVLLIAFSITSNAAHAGPFEVRVSGTLAAGSYDDVRLNGAEFEITYALDTDDTPDQVRSFLDFKQSTFAGEASVLIWNRPDDAADVVLAGQGFVFVVVNAFPSSSAQDGFSLKSFSIQQEADQIFVGALWWTHPDLFADESAVQSLSFLSSLGAISTADFTGIWSGFGDSESSHYTPTVHNIEFRVVPAPAAILLGVLGFGTAGMKLRRGWM